MTTANYLGHTIRWHEEKEEWVYMDGVPIKTVKRACTRCGRLPENGHDACIASLPGVRSACCGHGKGEGFIHFNDGRLIRGNFTVSFIRPTDGGSE